MAAALKRPALNRAAFVLTALVLAAPVLTGCGSETPRSDGAGSPPPAPSPAALSQTNQAPMEEDARAPEAAGLDVIAALGEPRAGTAERAMVAAANPYAVEAGLDILRQGGSAVDAAIAVQTVLGLVEPQSSGIGGGAFLMHFDAETRTVSAYDGRETAPAAVTADMFYDDNGVVLPFLEAVGSGRSTGAPGVLAMLELAHEDHGALDWAASFKPAIELALGGFTVSPRLELLLTNYTSFSRADDDPVSAAYFYPGGEPLKAGAIRDNPPYASTLETIAQLGAMAFYEGPIAESIVEAVQREPLPGALSLEDLANYEAKRREPVCTPLDGASHPQAVCSARAPSSGGVALGQISALYRLQDMAAASSAQAAEGMSLSNFVGLGAWRRFIEAQRLAYADRDHYVADADYVTVPTADLLHPDYLQSRAATIPDGAAWPKAVPGDPGAVLRGEPVIDMWGRDATEESPGTSHFTIVDEAGDVVSMTTSIEFAFGSGRMTTTGFLVNNQLTDFARMPELNGKPLANAAAPGKRPRSSMSPFIVVEQDEPGTGDFVLAGGSPGGNSIIAYNAKALIGVLNWGLSPQEAIELPNLVARGDEVSVEAGFPDDVQTELEAMGYTFKQSRAENSGLHMILRDPETGLLIGGADPRREGVARGY